MSIRGVVNPQTFPLQPIPLTIDKSSAINPIAPFQPTFLNLARQVMNPNVDTVNSLVQQRQIEELERLVQKMNNDMTQMKMNHSHTNQNQQIDKIQV